MSSELKVIHITGSKDIIENGFLSAIPISLERKREEISEKHYLVQPGLKVALSNYFN